MKTNLIYIKLLCLLALLGGCERTSIEATDAKVVDLEINVGLESIISQTRSVINDGSNHILSTEISEGFIYLFDSSDNIVRVIEIIPALITNEKGGQIVGQVTAGQKICIIANTDSPYASTVDWSTVTSYSDLISREMAMPTGQEFKDSPLVISKLLNVPADGGFWEVPLYSTLSTIAITEIRCLGYDDYDTLDGMASTMRNYTITDVMIDNVYSTWSIGGGTGQRFTMGTDPTAYLNTPAQYRDSGEWVSFWYYRRNKGYEYTVNPDIVGEDGITVNKEWNFCLPPINEKAGVPSIIFRMTRVTADVDPDEYSEDYHNFEDEVFFLTSKVLKSQNGNLVSTFETVSPGYEYWLHVDYTHFQYYDLSPLPNIGEIDISLLLKPFTWTQFEDTGYEII